MSVAIIRYNAGNIRSVVNALRRLGVDPVLTDDADELRRADKVLFPGQGEARTAMDYLREHHLDEVIKNLTQPFSVYASVSSCSAATLRRATPTVLELSLPT